MSANIVPGFFPYLGYLIKDVGARMAIWSHYLRTKRHMYPVIRHQNVRAYRGILPWTQDCCYIAPNAYVCGNVVLGHDVCVFYHACIRNYHTKTATMIGDHSVVMDRATFIGQVRVGKNAYIGIGATLDSCDVHDDVYIGHGACISLGVTIENGSIVAAGSVVPKDTKINAGELWAGCPARKVGDVDVHQIEEIHSRIHHQIDAAKNHKHALKQHMDRTRELDLNWLNEAIELMEHQQQQVSIKTPENIPLEAKRFLEPRVHMRRPELQLRVSYPINRIAPWMPKVAEATSNA